MFGFSKKKFQVNLAPRKRPAPEVTPPPSARPPILWWRIISRLLFLGAFIALVYYFPTITASLHRPAPPPQVRPEINVTPLLSTATNTLDRVIEEVQKQYLLPTGETPTMAIITSLEELKDQVFFAKAQVDDIVLMYMEAKKAILWRPSTRQIIEIGPILATPPPPGSATGTPKSSTKNNKKTK